VQVTVKSRVVGLAGACHPEPAVAVTVLAGALAVATGRSAWGVVAVVAAVGAGQLSVGWSNDYLDRDRDRVTGRGDKPVAAGALPAREVAAAALLAAAACIPLSFLSGLWPGVAHLVAVAAAWAYNLGVKSTVASAVPYAVAFALLAAFVVGGLPTHPLAPWWLLVAGGLLGTGAHFANVLPDLAADERTGVRGLPHRLGEQASRYLSAVGLLAASALLALGPWPPTVLALLGLAVAAILAVVGTVGGTAAFRTTIAVAALDVALLVASGTRVRS
jgi:4-hydroxybenzoate polyprenyltransferase